MRHLHVAALAKGITLGCAPRLDLAHFGCPEHDIYSRRVNKYLKWLQPVRPGDRLSLRLTVIEARRSRKRPQLGVLDWRWQLRNQQDTVVLELEVTSMFKLAPE